MITEDTKLNSFLKRRVGYVLPTLDNSGRRAERVYRVSLQRWMDFVVRQVRKDLTEKFIKDITTELTDWEYIEQQGEEVLKPATLSVMQTGGNAAYKLFQVQGAFDILNVNAVKAAEKSTVKLVKEVTAKTREGIRHYISTGIKEGKSMRTIARELKPIVGLTRNQTESIINYRARLEEEAAENIDKRVMSYTNKTQRRRLETIARTETARAQTMGYAIGLQDIGIEEVEFQVHPDERTCPICSGKDGDRYSVEDGEGVIPVHPSCRCVLLPVIDDIPTCQLQKSLEKRRCVPPGSLHDTQVDSLLKKLERSKDPDEKRKIRRALRKLGHKGGLTGRPSVKPAPRVKPTKPVVPRKKPKPVGPIPGQGKPLRSGGTFYHGTTEARARDILKNGFRPGKWKNYDKSVYGADPTKVVFVSSKKKVAEHYARDTSFFKGRGSSPVIFTIKVPKGQKLFVDTAPDVKAYGKGSAYYKVGAIPKAWIQEAKVHTGWGDWDVFYSKEITSVVGVSYIVLYPSPYVKPIDDKEFDFNENRRDNEAKS